MKRLLNHLVLAFIVASQSLWVVGCSDDTPLPQNYAKITNHGIDCNSTIEIGFKPPSGEGSSFSIMKSLK